MFAPIGGASALDIQAELSCGIVADQALYASFGFETQPVACQKVILAFAGTFGEEFGEPESEDSPFGHFGASNTSGATTNASLFYLIEIAPLYNSIRRIQTYPVGEAPYDEDADGGGLGLDWYKNIGTQTYYLGDTPVREAYIAGAGEHVAWQFGRVTNLAGEYDHQTFWGDSAKFAPYSHWLARNLYTGVTLSFPELLGLEPVFGVFSGNNPIKGYGAYYVDSEGVSVIDPNTKGNNTATYALRIGNSEGFFAWHMAWERGVLGSSWAPELLDGKRYNRVRTQGFVLGNDSAMRLHFVRTTYLSGLIEEASQASRAEDPPELREEEEWGAGLYRRFDQHGYYLTLDYDGGNWGISTTYEVFDRFDFNVWCGGLFDSAFESAADCARDDTQAHATQESWIFGLEYAINSHLAARLVTHNIRNPVQQASEISPNHGDTRTAFMLVAE